MLNQRTAAVSNQALIGLGLFVFGIWAAWQVGDQVVANNLRSLIFVAMGVAACAVAVTTLRNWRKGFYLFFIWVMFEDLARKYMGNGPLLFWGKDVLLACVYIALYIEIQRHREKTFRPPFLFFLSIFVWLGALQVFNQNSPSILYGLLGFKVYFYYVPLIWIGYALIQTDEDLRKLLVINAVLAGVIGSLGVVQAIVGNQFLNPRVLAPDLADLGNLAKSTPISGKFFSLPDSVFVSAGRYGVFLMASYVLALGTAAFLLLYTRRSRKLIFGVIGILGAATLLSGSRSAVVAAVMSTIVLCVGFMWAAPWRWGQAHRLIKAIRRSFVVAALGLACLIFLFPQAAGSRVAFYAETLIPSSSAYELSNRSWDYPITNLRAAFDQPNWLLGNGIGTASLGRQYVAKLLGRPLPNLGVEEGYGTLIIEMGIIAPFLWILWTAALLYYCWRIVRGVKGTRYAPIAIAILWYAFLLLYLWTYSGMDGYEDYTLNIYLWLLVGILFRLPDIQVATTPSAPQLVSSDAAKAAV